jgi:di/tricarboxylate transporter
LTNLLKAMLSFNPYCWSVLHITWTPTFGEFMHTGFPTTCWAMIMCELTLTVSHPPQEKTRWFKRSHTTRSLIWSRWRLPVDLSATRMDLSSFYVYLLFCKTSRCNKYSDYIVIFISIHSVIIYVVFFGACMRCTRLCPLNPGVTEVVWEECWL